MKHFTIYRAKSLTDYVVIKDMKTYFDRNFKLKIYFFFSSYVYKNIWIRDRVLLYWQPS